MRGYLTARASIHRQGGDGKQSGMWACWWVYASIGAGGLLGRCRAYEPRRSQKLNESQSILDADGQSVVRYDVSWCKLATIWTRTSAFLMKRLTSAVVVDHEER